MCAVLTTRARRSRSVGSSPQFEDIIVGDGSPATSGKKIAVHYTSKMTDGNQMDSSVDRDELFEYTVGVDWMIPGFHQGIAGTGDIPPMKVGGTRMLCIPHSMAYDKGHGLFPDEADLIFEVELFEVVSVAEEDADL